MEIANTVPQIIAIALALIGVVTTVIGLPGVWIVFLGMTTWAWASGFYPLTIGWLIFFFIISVGSTFVDNISVILGAKKYGATIWGMVGSIVGIVIGTIIANIPGLILGAFLGAVLFEMLFSKKDSQTAMKAGFGALLGFIFSNLIKLFIALAMVLAWWLIVK